MEAQTDGGEISLKHHSRSHPLKRREDARAFSTSESWLLYGIGSFFSQSYNRTLLNFRGN